jgi:P27 family predicted phage terminase small subunit
MARRFPKPTALKILEGNPGRRPIGKAIERIADLEPPAFITGQALEEWNRAVAAMPPGFFSAADAPTMAVYCLAWVMHRRALATVATEGQTAISSMGQKVPHPMLAVVRQQVDTILRAGDRLGMSPVARARFERGPVPAEVSKFDGLLGKIAYSHSLSS